MKWPNHGGQPEAIKTLLQIQTDKTFIDLSANLNPLGPPTWLNEKLSEQLESMIRYPDPTYSISTKAVAAHEGIMNEQILLTNGGAEAIFLVAKYFEGKKALIVHPTFLEYERACRHYHIDVEDMYYNVKNDFTLSVQAVIDNLHDKDVIFLCRPNNPTGTVIPEADLQQIIEASNKVGAHVVIDEAFADFLPNSIPSLTAWLTKYDHLILLRSLTKMYTIPGLRIGYLMAHSTLIQTLKSEQIPWSINSLANAIVPSLLDDSSFVKKTKDWLLEETEYIVNSLTELDYYLSPTTINFYLLKDSKQPEETEELFRFLLEEGIVTRHTHNFKGLNGDYLRIAIRSRGENEQVVAALKKWRYKA